MTRPTDPGRLAVVMALLDVEQHLTLPAIDFEATGHIADDMRRYGNAYLAGHGRDDIQLSIARWSKPPYGPGRSGTWRARLVRRTQ